MVGEIDNRLDEIDINLLIEQTGIPFIHITDEQITECLQNKDFIDTQLLYNGSHDKFSYKNNTLFDTKKIATIVNEIQNNTYNYNYPIPIWDDSTNDDTPEYDTDGNGAYQIRAFYYCQKNIYLSVNRSG